MGTWITLIVDGWIFLVSPSKKFVAGDVRVNVMALAALHVWRRPLPAAAPARPRRLDCLVDVSVMNPTTH